MNFKKKDHPEHYLRKQREKKNVTHHINIWDEWCEICEEYEEDPYTCFEITLGDKDGSNWESFEFDGSPQKMD